MEELLLPPEHSLSSPLLRTERKEHESGGERKEGATEMRHIRGEKRRRKRKIEEWCSEKRQKKKEKERKETGTGKRIDVRNGYATSP